MVKEVQRREEKLKETVDLLERQLIIEDKEHQELKKKLDEKAQLVPRESSGTSSILEKPVSVSSSSSSTPKRVRFQVPESFVGHSLTPISAKQASLLRDAPEADNFDGWTMPGSIARKVNQSRSIIVKTWLYRNIFPIPYLSMFNRLGITANSALTEKWQFLSV